MKMGQGGLPSYKNGDAGPAQPAPPGFPRPVVRDRSPWQPPPDTRFVGSPGRWGNPHKVVQTEAGWWCMLDRTDGLLFATEAAARAQACLFYEERLHATPGRIAEAQKRLRGRNLACDCRLAPRGAKESEWCHRGLLLQVANAPLICATED